MSNHKPRRMTPADYADAGVAPPKDAPIELVNEQGVRTGFTYQRRAELAEAVAAWARGDHTQSRCDECGDETGACLCDD